MCGKPHPKGFRTVPHSDTLCRIFFGPEKPYFRRFRPPHGNHLISVIAVKEPIDGRRADLADFCGYRRSPVLVPSPYAYQEASWLVPAEDTKRLRALAPNFKESVGVSKMASK